MGYYSQIWQDDRPAWTDLNLQVTLTLMSPPSGQVTNICGEREREREIKSILKLKQNFRKNKLVFAKTLFFVIGPFCTPKSTCLNIGF